jgi:hypothetical protein
MPFVLVILLIIILALITAVIACSDDAVIAVPFGIVLLFLCVWFGISYNMPVDPEEYWVRPIVNVSIEGQEYQVYDWHGLQNLTAKHGKMYPPNHCVLITKYNKWYYGIWWEVFDGVTVIPNDKIEAAYNK